MEMRINIREIVKDEIDKALNGLDQRLDKHTKGYMFDSLVYRFKDYQSRAFNYEVAQIKHQMSQLDAEAKVKDRHNRDLMRFIQILDEAIGEHD